MSESIIKASLEILLAELVERARLEQFDAAEIEEATRLIQIGTNSRGVIAATRIDYEAAHLMARAARRRGEWGLESVYRRRAGLALDVLGMLRAAEQPVGEVPLAGAN